MRPGTLIAALVLGSSLVLSGCSDAKAKKCEVAYTNMLEIAGQMAKAFGGGKAAAEAVKMKSDAFKATFVEKCKELPDEVIECMDMTKLKAEPKKCGELMSKYKDKMPKP